MSEESTPRPRYWIAVDPVCGCLVAALAERSLRDAGELIDWGRRGWLSFPLSAKRAAAMPAPGHWCGREPRSPDGEDRSA